jgi:hypothetical protein
VKLAAVAAHGHGRLTVDVDVVLRLRPNNVSRAMNVLVALGYQPAAPVRAELFADEAIRESWIRDKGMVVFRMLSSIHRDTPVDLFLSEPCEFDAEYDRALMAPLSPGVVLPCAALDTLIAMKRSAARAKDLEDVRQLELLRQGPPRG